MANHGTGVKFGTDCNISWRRWLQVLFIWRYQIQDINWTCHQATILSLAKIHFCCSFKFPPRIVSCLVTCTTTATRKHNVVFTLNKSPNRINRLQSDLFHCKIALHVSRVTAPIIRSTKNCNRSYRSYSEIQGLTVWSLTTNIWVVPHR